MSKKKLSNSWLSGICYHDNRGFRERRNLRRRMLEVSKPCFIQRLVLHDDVFGLVRERQFKNYSKVKFSFDDMPKIINTMMDSGFDIHNIDELFNEAPLPEFKTLITSQNGTKADVIFAKSKEKFQRRITDELGDDITFDCPLDIYMMQSDEKRVVFRITRMKIGDAYQIYTEVRPLALRNISRQFNYCQDTGVKLLRIWLAMQFLFIHFREAFKVSGDGAHIDKVSHIGVDGRSHLKVKALPTYILSDISMIEPANDAIMPSAPRNSTYRSFAIGNKGFDRDDRLRIICM